MKWMGRRESGNVDDRRGMSGGKLIAGGGVIGLIVLLVNMFLGGDAAQLVTTVQQQVATGEVTQRELTLEEQKIKQMMATLLADTEDVWGTIFSENGAAYRKPTLVLFTEAVQTGCGNATSAAGPFYCPADEKIYMDMAFFVELEQRFGAKGGDFAIAYVLAHEVGHHVQTVLGTSEKVRRLQERVSPSEANELSVALELQADFYAGLWTHYNQKRTQFLESGDIEEAISAAAAVGDDAIQRRMQGHVNPDSFTHGTSAQRIEWFKKGYETGDIRRHNTFAALGIDGF